MKALEKDRRRRYETANDFAADVMRYLTDQPVEACPPSAWYRFRKFASRNRRSLATTAVLAVSGLIVGLVLWRGLLQNVSRVRQLAQDVRQSLAGARTAIEARDLTLAGSAGGRGAGPPGGRRARCRIWPRKSTASGARSRPGKPTTPLQPVPQGGERCAEQDELRLRPGWRRTRRRGVARALRRLDGERLAVSAGEFLPDRGPEAAGPGDGLCHPRFPGRFLGSLAGSRAEVGRAEPGPAATCTRLFMSRRGPSISCAAECRQSQGDTAAADEDEKRSRRPRPERPGIISCRGTRQAGGATSTRPSAPTRPHSPAAGPLQLALLPRNAIAVRQVQSSRRGDRLLSGLPCPSARSSDRLPEPWRVASEAWPVRGRGSRRLDRPRPRQERPGALRNPEQPARS